MSMTAEEIAKQVWDAWVTNEHESTAQIIVRFANAITEAEERGRVEMREKCAQVAKVVGNNGGRRWTDYGSGDMDFISDVADRIENRIRALPTASEEPAPSQSEK